MTFGPRHQQDSISRNTTANAGLVGVAEPGTTMGPFNMRRRGRTPLSNKTAAMRGRDNARHFLGPQELLNASMVGFHVFVLVI
jgi:hypothetical protein